MGDPQNHRSISFKNYKHILKWFGFGYPNFRKPPCGMLPVYPFLIINPKEQNSKELKKICESPERPSGNQA